MRSILLFIIILYLSYTSNGQDKKSYLSANLGTTATNYSDPTAPYVSMHQQRYGRTLSGGYFTGGYGVKKELRKRLAGTICANIGLRRFYFITDTLPDVKLRRTARLKDIDLHVNQFLLNLNFSLSTIIGKHFKFNYGIAFNGSFYNDFDNVYSAKGRNFTDYFSDKNKLNWSRFDAGVIGGVTYNKNKIEGGFQYYADLTRPTGINHRNSFVFVVPSLFVAYYLN